MAVVVHFPMGAGGNLLRNIITLAPNFEILGYDRVPIDENNKESFLLDYYATVVTADTWLDREWSIRQGLYNKYYNLNVPYYWNPEYHVAYDNHGEITIKDLNIYLSHYDRYQIGLGTKTEKNSTWKLKECYHVFIDVTNLSKINKLYNSKNPNATDSLLKNTNWYNNILKIKEYLVNDQQKIVTTDVQKIFNDNGYQEIQYILSKLNLTVNPEIVEKIHKQWLQTTREIYYNQYNKELRL